jgi:hypothetical protein
MSAENQEAERLAARLEAAARSIRDAMKPPQRGVFLHRAKMGYTVCVDGFDLGLDTSWSDADALCQAIATRRPPGDEKGYGVNFHWSTPFGMSARDHDKGTVTIGISVRERTEG